jgi:uncharacterized protein
MRVFLLATLCLALVAPCVAQTSDSDPATRDDIILYLRTMRSHDMFRKMMEVQSQSMQKLLRDQLLQDTGTVPPEFSARMKKAMADLIQEMPVDDIVQAMIPAYQKHFTRSDIRAMIAFYSSPVGQKVLQELPVVTQEGMQAAMPILTKYLDVWKTRMQENMKDLEKNPPQPEPAVAQPQ